MILKNLLKLKTFNKVPKFNLCSDAEEHSLDGYNVAVTFSKKYDIQYFT